MRRTALERLEQHRLLCAHRTGSARRAGVDAGGSRTGWPTSIDDVTEGEWYAGRPVLVTANDYALGLFNGDTGVVVRDADASLRVVFGRERRRGRLRPAPARRRCRPCTR